jgi:histidinol-phosphate/aromatic aminotransferase/cobyric acid decarboxylase-like protein
MQTMQHELGLLGWACRPSAAPFFLAEPAWHEAVDAADMLTFLRQHGIKLRDAHGMGLPGLVRLRAHVPDARQALLHALKAWSDQQASKRKAA